jgi:hypothetical protein
MRIFIRHWIKGGKQQKAFSQQQEGDQSAATISGP